MKNGLIFENDELMYYKDGEPFHAGVIKENGDIYYIGRGGKAVKGEHVVHKEMSNDILKHGTYVFGEDYKLIVGSYTAPKARKKKKKFSRKKKRDIAILIAVASVFLCVVVVPWIFKKVGNDKSSSDSNASLVQTDIMLPTFDSEVMLFSEDAKLFYEGKIPYESAIMSGTPYRPLTFRYLIRNSVDGKLFLSEKADFSDCKEAVLPHNEGLVTIDNLKTGTTYYYRVEHSGETYEGEFKTAHGVRFIEYPGMTNARDIGGYKTLDGKEIKQGLLIRGGEIDGLAEPSYIMDKTDAARAMRELGFVYDMDLRNSKVFIGKYTSRFGEGLRHDFFDSPQYGLVFNYQYKESVKRIFSALADENNYPMYLHCTHGVDRTGSMVFLLQGILGVPEAKMISEYLNSGFVSKGYVERKNIDTIISSLENYEGKTINEKIENFLINDIGVTEEEIESIRGILLEN